MSKTILTLGKTATLTTLDITRKDLRIVKHTYLGDFNNMLLEAPELFSAWFTNNINIAYIEANEFYVCFTDNVYYKNLRLPIDSFVDEMDKLTSEKEERVLNLCIENIPNGLLDLNEAYIPSVISSYKTEDEYSIACAYIPEIYINSITKACEDLGLSLYGIFDMAYSLHNLMQVEDSNILLSILDKAIFISEYGVIISPYSSISSSLNNVILEIADKYYPVEDIPIQNIESIDIPNYARIALPMNLEEETICAIGCVLEKNIVATPKKSGGKESVISQIRKLLNTKTSSES